MYFILAHIIIIDLDIRYTTKLELLTKFDIQNFLYDA